MDDDQVVAYLGLLERSVSYEMIGKFNTVRISVATPERSHGSLTQGMEGSPSYVIINLPSKHTGGEVIVTWGERRKVTSVTLIWHVTRDRY